MCPPVSLGGWLKERRRALDLTQGELAQRVGCSTVTIHKLETGASHPSKEMAERLACCLGLPTETWATFVRFARGGSCGPSLLASTSSRTPTAHGTYHLPVSSTKLIGREIDLAALRKRLRDGARLVTLLGPPGIGKTRLALELAYQMLDEFAEGVFFVPLAPVADPTLVADAIGQALSMVETRVRPMADQIKSYLREKQTLLILDNFEHVVEAAPLVADLLVVCPWLTILCTSRQPLRIRGERQYPVPPLAVPEPPAAILPALTTADALRYPAIALFVERAQAVAPGFALNDAEAGCVAEICRRLDGVPLAIELSAAHIKLLSPKELLERWQGSLILSSGRLRDAPLRHQTLENAVDWSYGLLDEREKKLLGGLAVFAGGADLRAIEAVCECQDLACLASLVDKSLVKRMTGADGEGRFVLLEMIREYALARLVASGQETVLRLKHAAYYQRLAAEARQGVVGPQQLAWFRRLEIEQPNLRAVLQWTLKREALEAPVAVGLCMAVDLFWFWTQRGHLREGLEWFESGLAATQDEDGTPARANALWEAGACAAYLGLGCKSGAYLDAAVTACRAVIARSGREGAAVDTSLPHSAGEAVAGLGYALALRAFFSTRPAVAAAARADFDASVRIFRETRDEFGLAYALNCFGHWASRNGDMVSARPALEESLTLFQRTGNLWGANAALANLHRLYELVGEREQIERMMATLLPTYGHVAELGEMQRIQVVLWWLSYWACTTGDESSRLPAFRQAINVQRLIGFQLMLGAMFFEPTYLALQAGMPTRAVRLAAAAQRWLEQLKVDLASPPELEAALAEARRQLPEGAYARAWAEGRAMTISESAAYALSGEE
jgi:predicted ATPase/DNA-binding XRE family transcriptional regulator